MRKRTAIRVISYLCVAVLAFGVLTYVQYNRAQQYKQYMTASYQHSFAELVSSMSEVDSALQKSLYATSSSVAAAMCTEVFGKAMMAQMSLGMMPYTTVELEQTAGFISRVGDYAYSLSRSASKGTGYTGEERENLKALSQNASLLYENLHRLQIDMSDGHLTVEELEESQDRMDQMERETGDNGDAPATLGSSMRLIEGEFPEVPSLIYDGPFSEHLTNAEPALLEGAKEISESNARKTVADFLGMQEGRVVLAAKGEGRLKSYYFTAKTSTGEVTAELSVLGGKIINMMNSRDIGETRISDDEAIKIAQTFLERRGYKNMRESYYMKEGGIMTINFAYMQDDIMCYSDLLKVGVGLDDGSIVSFEARGYIMNHRARELPAQEVSIEQARELVSDDLEILGEATTVIPTAGNYELLCHEYKCQTEDEKKYIIYVNAVTGEQERILILLEDENGALTV